MDWYDHQCCYKSQATPPENVNLGHEIGFKFQQLSLLRRLQPVSHLLPIALPLPISPYFDKEAEVNNARQETALPNSSLANTSEPQASSPVSLSLI